MWPVIKPHNDKTNSKRFVKQIILLSPVPTDKYSKPNKGSKVITGSDTQRCILVHNN